MVKLRDETVGIRSLDFYDRSTPIVTNGEDVGALLVAVEVTVANKPRFRISAATRYSPARLRL